jgi:hypothetical protein
MESPQQGTEDNQKFGGDGTVGLALLRAAHKRPCEHHHADLGIAIEGYMAAFAEDLVPLDAPP